MELIENHICFGGKQQVWKHFSPTLDCEMRIAVYLPPQVKDAPCPVLYWLSGLTCTEQNFITKAGAQAYAAKYGVILVAPDTSPRGEGVANDDAYDLGQGAGFYINATQSPWAKHYHMFDYVTDELPTLIEKQFPATGIRSISGHSMGGHGALICHLKKPNFYASCSAFSPICAPSQVPWGEKAFHHYLGEDASLWQPWDACCLLAKTDNKIEIMIDQGEADDFLEPQLKPERLVQIAKDKGHNVMLRLQPGYDHSYYFIASFIEDHIAYHAKAMKCETAT